jgi:hypothetical protein
MRPGDNPSAPAAPGRAQAPSLIHMPGPRPSALAPGRFASESDAAIDPVPRARPHLFDDGGSSAFVRSRQAEEAAARARSLSSEGQMNLRSSPWQDADGELSGSVAVASARRPAANAAGDGGSSLAAYHVPAPAASDSLAVFEKPLLAALSGEDVGGVTAAEVSSLAIALPCLWRPVCDRLAFAGFKRPLHGACELLRASWKGSAQVQGGPVERWARCYSVTCNLAAGRVQSTLAFKT